MATNFNSSPFSFLDSSGPSNPMMQEVPILGQQDFSTPAPQSSGFTDKVVSFAKSITDLLKQDPNLPQAGSTASAFGGMTQPGVLDTAPEQSISLSPTLQSLFIDPMERFGQFSGEQLYGTGVNAKGQPIGFPIDRPSFFGDLATLPGTALNVAGILTDPIQSLARYSTGRTGIDYQPSLDDSQPEEINQQSVLDILNLPNAEQAGQDLINQGRRSSNMPLSVDETRALLEERFGAPTISAIQALPAGEGLGLRVDPQGRMISPGDDRSTFDLRSAERLARLEQRDLRPGETQIERDTRLADARTGGAERGGEMSFEEARKFVVRKENSRGEKESMSSYNARIKAFQTKQNSTLNQLKEQYEQFRVAGERVNNERIAALAARYQQTEPQRYRQVLQVGQQMLEDGLLEDQLQLAMYVVREMGGKPSEIFETNTPEGSTNPIIDQITQSGQGSANYNSVEEAEAANLRAGTRITINGRPAVVQ
mgnify:FL=1